MTTPESPVVLLRWYYIVCPVAAVDALLAQLQAIPTAQEGEFNMSSELGPEHEPDYGLASTITHKLDAPGSAEATFLAARALVQAVPGAHIRDNLWLVLDDGQPVYVYPDNGGDLLEDLELYFYDETINP